MKFTLLKVALLMMAVCTAAGASAQSIEVYDADGNVKATHSIFDANSIEFSAAGAVSYGSVDMLTIQPASGQSWHLMLDEAPTVTLVYSGIEITAGDKKIEYVASEPFDIIPGDSAGISAVLSESGAIAYQFDGNTIHIYNIPPNGRVMLYSVAGMLLWSGNANADGTIDIDIAVSHSPILLVSAGRTLKISKR